MIHAFESCNRRGFLKANAAVLGSGAWVLPAIASGAEESEKKGPEITPVEDLMQEHGVLRRILLVYRGCLRRLDLNETLSPNVITDAATIIRSFIENYHERSEEEYVFPRFGEHGELVDLSVLLKSQHEAGRVLTDRILTLAATGDLALPDRKQEMILKVTAFIHMYEPHAAREDTVLFPAFRGLVKPEEYDTLGDRFEERELELLGANGFEGTVKRIADIEKGLDIFNLAKFTPT